LEAEKEKEAFYEKRYSILFVLMLGGIMGPIDASIVNVILPTISSYFGAPIATVQWVPMIYLLMISSLLLFYGRLGDIFGYRRLYLLGLAGFILASAFCGLAPSVDWLILARALQGMMAGMMMSVPMAITTAVFPAEERGKALGINAISVSAGLAIGPSLGGFIASFWSWRMAFLINVPIGIAALIWGSRILPSLKGKGGRVDYKGALAAFIFLFSFLFFINIFQRSGLNLITALSLILAIAAAVIFFYFETHTSEPMLNLELFKRASFSFGLLSALLNFMAQYIMVFVTPFFLQRVLDFDSGQTGLLMTCFPLAVMAVAPFSGALSDRIGTRTLASLGAAICAAALLAMAFLPLNPPSWEIGWRLALFGIGTGIFQSPNNSAVMGSAPRPYLGIASGTLAMIRNVGMALGIAAGGLVLYSIVPAGIMGAFKLSGEEVIIFIKGLRAAYLAGAAFTALAAIFALIREK